MSVRDDSSGSSSRLSGRRATTKNVVVYRDMNEAIHSPQCLSDSDLIAEVNHLAQSEREAIAALVAALGEMDSRRLYLGQGCSSMFTYCTQVLHLAEHAAFNRIEAARAARRYPTILTLLADGRLHLSAVRLLAPHLTDSNHDAVIADASHKSKRDVEKIVAHLQPRPDVPSSVRRLPVPTPHTKQPLMVEPQAMNTKSGDVEAVTAPSAVPTPAQKSDARPLAPGRYKIQFTVSEETYRKLRRVQDLLRHQNPTGDPSVVFDRALTLLLTEVERSRLALTVRPREASKQNPGSRYVPAAVRRRVWERDGGRCRFEGAAGRCSETGRLEFHHVVPYADGGSTTADNLELRCAAHNRHEAEEWFGPFVRERPAPYECSFANATL